MATNWTFQGVLAENKFELSSVARSVAQYQLDTIPGSPSVASPLGTADGAGLEVRVLDISQEPLATTVGNVGATYRINYTDGGPVFENFDLGFRGVQKGSIPTIPTRIGSQDDPLVYLSTSIKGSTEFGNNDGGSLSHNESFGGRFNSNGSTIFNYTRTDSWVSSNSAISKDSSTIDGSGNLNISFSLATNVGTGTYVATHRTEVKAVNGVGTSTQFIRQDIEITFTVTQGQRPTAIGDSNITTSFGTINRTFGDPADDRRVDGNFRGRFSAGDAPIDDWSLEGSSSTAGNNVTATRSLTTGTTPPGGDYFIKHEVLSSIPLGTWVESSYLRVRCKNKYGWADTDRRYTATSTWVVSADVPLAGSSPVGDSKDTGNATEGTGIYTNVRVYSLDNHFDTRGGGAMTFAQAASGTPTDIGDITWSTVYSGSRNETLTITFSINTNTATPGVHERKSYIRVRATNSAGTSIGTVTFYNWWEFTVNFV